MHKNPDLIEVHVFLKNNEKRILKSFQRVANPARREYARYKEVPLINERTRKKAMRFFDGWKGTSYKETDFPDIFTLWTTKEEIRRHKMPRFIDSIEYEPAFEEVLYIWTHRLPHQQVEILPRVPPIGRTLKRRLNLECMIEGLQGKTLLVPIDSILAELPAVTVFTDQPCPKFSKDFERREYANYQHDFVSVYLHDPESKGFFRKTAVEKGGRASPDITLKDPTAFVSSLTRLERPLGFLGYLFYQNIMAFKKVEMAKAAFPHSDSLWNANSGLGEPKIESIIKIFQSHSSR